MTFLQHQVAVGGAPLVQGGPGGGAFVRAQVGDADAAHLASHLRRRPLFEPEVQAVDAVQAHEDSVLPRVVRGTVLRQARTAAGCEDRVKVGPETRRVSVGQGVNERRVP